MPSALKDLHALAGALARLAPPRLAPVRNWVAVMGLPIRTRVPIASGWAATVTLEEAGREHRFRVADYADAHALREVFVDRQYELDAAVAPEAILDLGAHVGAATLFFRLAYPEARIVSVEPDSQNYAALRRNVGDLPGVDLVPAAVGGAPGTASVVRRDLSWATQVVPGAHGAETVPVHTLNELIARAGADAERTLVKLDVEGAEWDILSRCDVRSLYGIVGEVHYDLIPVERADFHGLFEDLDVEIEPLTDGSAVFSVLSPSRSSRR